MSYENWKNKAQGFQTVDVRRAAGLLPQSRRFLFFGCAV